MGKASAATLQVLQHYLKVIIRDKYSTLTDRDGLQEALDRWIADYVDDGTATPTELARLPRPFAAAKITVEQQHGESNCYTTKFWIRPND